jgi:transposase
MISRGAKALVRVAEAAVCWFDIGNPCLKSSETGVSGHRQLGLGVSVRVCREQSVITSVLSGQSQSEVASRYGVSKGWVSKLMSRYRTEGEAAFWPRRPHSSPTAIPPAPVELIILLRKELSDQGLDAGPDTLCWHLAQHHGITVSRTTVARYLTRAGLITPEPKKRPAAPTSASKPSSPTSAGNRISSTTDSPAPTAAPAPVRRSSPGSMTAPATRCRVTAHHRITARIVLTTFRAAVAAYGPPPATLTDNGMVYTVRFAGRGRRGGRTSLETELQHLGITQKNGAPAHPQTQGKAERFQQTLKK